MFDTKIAVLLRDDLASWQALNVTAFLVSGLPQELRGEPYVDADDVTYLSMFRQPVVVLQGDKALLTKAHERALTRNQPMSIFTADLFSTGNDADNRAAVAAVPTEDLDLVGLAVHAPRKDVDKITKGLDLHP